MIEKKENKFLTVAPFECAWIKDSKFREAGRGCVAFEAFAHNDVTVVFRENVGTQHYHYKRDTSPHYTVILGSNRNRRLKIEVDGKTVVDVEGVALCCTSSFQGYWISIYDGFISVGKGRYPFQNVVFQWLDENPHCRNVQYVGLSSWDKHVGYRNVNVLPLTHNHISLWKHVDSSVYYYDDDGGTDDEDELQYECIGYSQWGLGNFLESWDLSDMYFIVGKEERPVPAHKVILGASGQFPISSLAGNGVIQLPHVTYPVLHALLEYIYTGQTQISDSLIGSLRALSLEFEVMQLVKQCEEALERLKTNKMEKNVEMSYPSSRSHCSLAFPFGLPINKQMLKLLQLNGEYCDLNLYIEGHGFVSKVHKVILSLWSVPFAKMFTNGMSESASSEVRLKDISPKALRAMLEFMYSGILNLEESTDSGTSLLQLLLLADQFGVYLLHQECCKTLLECLSKDSVCTVLQVVSSLPSCKLIEETCERTFSTHFDYCTTASTDFVMLDEMNFRNIIQHPDLTVTSEERVLNAILMWGMKARGFCGWETLDEVVKDTTPQLLFGERLQHVNVLLTFVRFPLLQRDLLEKLVDSNLVKHFQILYDLVKEAVNYTGSGLTRPRDNQNLKFQHRQSSFKELLYICDGDSNGVLYYAGTAYGEHQWVNPVLAKRIAITASSPASRFTDPKALASRTYQGTSLAGPRMEDGHTCAWWMVDLGQDHQLMCNYYTLRQDGSRAFTRFWNLQGSLDGKSWADLRVHENDQTICKPGQFASWPVVGPNALLPFRYFRVVLTGPTTDVTNPWNLCICFLELYGFFK